VSKAVLRNVRRPGFDQYEDTIPEWYHKAPCLGLAELMFDEAREAEAKEVCRTCPFQEACLELALTNEEEFGVWGNTTPQERLNLHV
jgi:WhiB family transcriptional regulator, redox-sensing transcriptional regulator